MTYVEKGDYTFAAGCLKTFGCEFVNIPRYFN
jgi:hypothetical protein